METAGGGRVQPKSKPDTQTYQIKLAGGRLFKLKVTREPKPIKTLMMRLMDENLRVKLGVKLEDVLWAGTEAQVGELLGIHYTTVAKWRKRLGGPNGRNGA